MTRTKEQGEKLLRKAKDVALLVSRDLSRTLRLGPRWHAVNRRFDPGNGAFGWYSVAGLDDDEKVAFDVWVDRESPDATSSVPAPMLAAAFCDEYGLWNNRKNQFPELKHRRYGSLTGRAGGFGGEVFYETDADHRYLSLYRPSAWLGLEKKRRPNNPLDGEVALKEFSRLFHAWRVRVEKAAPTVKLGTPRYMAGLRESVLVGLLGELAVLQKLKEKSPRWLPGTQYDIEVGTRRIEVKTFRPGKEACRLSLAQIKAATAPSQQFALVGVSEEARQILLDDDAEYYSGGTWLKGYEEGIKKYLRAQGVLFERSLLGRLKRTLSLVSKSIRFRRFEPPTGWREALKSLNALGAVKELSQEFEVDQFVKL